MIDVGELEDQASIINIGHNHELRRYMQMRVDHNEKSSWVHYPDKYKFFSLNFVLSDEFIVTERETYDLLSFAGDVGGALEFLRIFASALFLPFSALRMKALIANRLYHISTETTDLSKYI